MGMGVFGGFIIPALPFMSCVIAQVGAGACGSEVVNESCLF